jgi:ABC-type multidrug transport system ATPase subunit
MVERVSDPPALRFRAVGKSFAGVPRLEAVSLDVPTGAFHGLVGVNGAGKTTLIRCLLDANRADTGQIEIFGESSLQTSARQHLAFLPERFGAPFYLTGRDFLTAMARLHGRRVPEPEVLRTMDALELDRDALVRPVRSYSKGMTQKLGLAACLLSGRRLLVLDEPASGLDPRARAALKTALAARHAAGTTIFLTSHALADVDEMCGSMALLHDGRLLFDGSPDALRARHGAASLEAAFLAELAADEASRGLHQHHLAQSGAVSRG